jgi:hypothetical protein
MLPNSIVHDPRTEKIWAESTGKEKKPQITGYLLNGTYWQSYDHDHLIRNAGARIVNSKGMDVGVYRQLSAPRQTATHTWRIVEAHTKKELYIPFKSIGILLQAKVAKEANIGYGLQIFVPLDRFSPPGTKTPDIEFQESLIFKEGG